MAQKKQVTMAEMKVGALVTVALVFLAALILQQSWGIAWFSESERVLAYLPDVGGLKPGNPVWLAGIEIGKVRQVSIMSPELYSGNARVFKQISELKKEIENLDRNNPNYGKQLADKMDKIRDLKLELRLVEVQMDIKKDYINRISVDSEVAIASRGLIGDSFLEVSPGTAGIPPKRQGEFYVVEGVRTTGFREIITGANDVIANFGVLSEQFRSIAGKINPDKVGADMAGTLEDMRTALHEASTTFSETTRLARELREGQGSIGRMVSDPGMYNRLNEILDKMASFADRMENGPGTLPKLMNDSQIFDSASAALKKADLAMDRIEKGEGTLGRLSKDPALYDSGRRAMEKFAGFVDQIDKGEGTLGKLVKDPTLYNNMNQSSAEIAKLIYDLRQDPKKYLTIRFRLF
jgi:phospholipid/cholesterol/gamma-HCH transport system substrate-binding protein